MANVKPVQLGSTTRMSFSKINEVLDMPNLIEVQKNSYQWFLDQGLREVFQQQAHGDRRDERRHARALAPHRPVGHQLDHNAHERADHDRRKHPRPRRQSHAVQQDRHGEIQRIAADHDEVAVRKVNESDNAVNHRIAERHERIDAAEAQPDDELL